MCILKRREYRDGIKRKGDKIGMGPLHSSERRTFLVRCPEDHYTSLILLHRGKLVTAMLRGIGDIVHFHSAL